MIPPVSDPSSNDPATVVEPRREGRYEYAPAARDTAANSGGIVTAWSGWLAGGLSILVHAGLVVGLCSVARTPLNQYPPRVRFAHGQSAAPVTVRFIADDDSPLWRTQAPDQHTIDGPIPNPTNTPPPTPDTPNQHKPKKSSTTTNTPPIPSPQRDQPQPTTSPTPTPPPNPVDPPRRDRAEARDTDKGVETGARVAFLPTPRYPPLSRARGEQGVVVLEVEVLPDGGVGTVRVLEEPGYPRLTSAAIDAVRAARFEPAINHGRPVRSIVKVPFTFVLR